MKTLRRFNIYHFGDIKFMLLYNKKALAIGQVWFLLLNLREAGGTLPTVYIGYTVTKPAKC